MFLVHGPRTGGAHRLERARTPVTCIDCGHPAAMPSSFPIVRLARWVRSGNSCGVTEHDAGSRSDSRCGCLSASHAG